MGLGHAPLSHHGGAWVRSGGGGGWTGQELPLGPEGAPQPPRPACRGLDAPSWPRPFAQVFPVCPEPWQAGHRLGGDSSLARAHLLCTLPRGEVRNLTRLQQRWETPPQGPRRDRCGWAAGSLPHPHGPGPGRPSPASRLPHTDTAAASPQPQAPGSRPESQALGCGVGWAPPLVGSPRSDGRAGDWGPALFPL